MHSVGNSFREVKIVYVCDVQGVATPQHSNIGVMNEHKYSLSVSLRIYITLTKIALAFKGLRRYHSHAFSFFFPNSIHKYPL